MARIEFQGLPILTGAVPYTDAVTACEKILHYLKDIPTWPQLPRLSYLEDPYIQFSEGFPGIVVSDEKIWVNRERDLDSLIYSLDSAYRQNQYFKFPISKQYAAGLQEFLTYKDLPVRAIEGQITGPISWGMTVTDNDGQPIALDEDLLTATAKFLRLKAVWMEAELREISPNTIIFIDEPLLENIDSDAIKLDQDLAVRLIRGVLEGIRGLKGIHGNGKPEWPLIIKMGPDIIGFNAYNYAQSLSTNPRDIRKYLSDGGIIAWGIVPNEESNLKQESTGSLQDRLEESMAILTRKDFDMPFRQIMIQSLITSSGSLASMSPDGADRALEILATLSSKIKSRWG